MNGSPYHPFHVASFDSKPIRQLKVKLGKVEAKLKKYYDAFENTAYEKELFADRIAELTQLPQLFL